jgi:hypothetical protein
MHDQSLSLNFVLARRAIEANILNERKMVKESNYMINLGNQAK